MSTEIKINYWYNFKGISVKVIAIAGDGETCTIRNPYDQKELVVDTADLKDES